MNICQEIEELRRHMRQMRKRISAQTRALWSQDIRGNLDELLDSIKERREDRPLLVFAPMDEEINLWPWIKKGWEEGREQYFPLTKEGELRFYPASSVFDLEPGLWGIKEPVRRENPYQSGFAIAIVPGLAFDVSGSRVGYGGGYYDRFLREHKDLIRIAVAYCFQISDDPIPQADWDQKMDYIVTEEKWIDCSRYRSGVLLKGL